LFGEFEFGESHWSDFAYFLAEFWITGPPSFENQKLRQIIYTYLLGLKLIPKAKTPFSSQVRIDFGGQNTSTRENP
jgi:hypothetical protein